MLKQLLLSICLISFTACSTVPYNTRREVRVEKKWYGTSFKQADNRVDPNSIASKLARRPQYKDQVQSFGSSYKWAQALGLLAGFGFLWSAGGGFDETGTLVGSLLMGGGSAYLYNQAAKKLVPIVDQRNKFVYDYKMIDTNNYQAKKKEIKIVIPIYVSNF